MRLRETILCKICQTPHKKKNLKRGESAHCVRCGALLYRPFEGGEYRFLTFSLSACIVLILLFFFPLVTVTFAQMQSKTSLYEAIWQLLELGYPLVAFFVLMVLAIYPLTLFISAFLASLFLIVGFKAFAKRALVVLTLTSEWSMIDIFFVAILVAMVKIYEYASIEFGVAFWALGFVVCLEIYLVRYLGVECLWEVWEDRFDTL